MGTWTKANSPYILTCDVLVADLIIEPGVTVSASNYTFEVAGVLTAVGSAEEPIVFKAQNPAVGWQGIFFNYSSPGSVMAHCVVSNSVNSGARIVKSVPYLEHCTIANNSSLSGHGGGVYVDILRQGDLVLRSCTIANNTARYHGGGIAAWMSTNTLILECCDIRSNSANPGGGQGDYYGGGACVVGRLLMSNCKVVSNAVYGCASSFADSSANGGGLYTDGPAEVNNCTFRGNYAREWLCGGLATARAYGAGMRAAGSGPLEVANSVFSHNTSAGDNYNYGSGLAIHSSVTSPRVVNCTFAYNSHEGLNSVPWATVMNSIFFFNAGGGTQITGATNVTYCDVQGGFPGEGNISFSPIFHSTTNLVIVPGSRCIDAGNPATDYNDSWFKGDFFGAAFSLGTARNDMGAHGGPDAWRWKEEPMAPHIAVQPQNRSSCLGRTVSFSVGAVGTEPLAYQWYFQNAELPGATSAQLSLTNLQAGNAGVYHVTVSNQFGGDVSAPARLVVNDACVDIRMYAGLQIDGRVGATYILKYTTDLGSPFSEWLPLGTNVMTSEGWFYLDMESPFSPKRFYGVQLQP